MQRVISVVLGTVCSLSAATLVTFAVEQDTKPKGTAIIPILILVLCVSALALLSMTDLVRSRIPRLASSGPDPKVSILEDDWEVFNWQARIVEVHFKVENRRNKRKKLTGTALHIPGRLA